MSDDTTIRFESVQAKATELTERAKSRVAMGPPAAQAARLLALSMLQQLNVEGCISHVKHACEWVPDAVLDMAEEADVDGSAAAAIHRYFAGLSGEQAIITRNDFKRAWVARTGADPDAVDPFFASIVQTFLPLLESILQQVEQQLDNADALTTA